MKNTFGQILGMDATHLQRNGQFRADMAAVLLEGIGRLLQSMVDVDGLHLSGPAPHGGQQEDGGVGAAAVGDGERQGQFQPCQRSGRRIARRISRLRPWCR